MANKNNLSISVVVDGLKEHSNGILDSIDLAARYAAQLTDAQDGQTDVIWGRILYSLANTGISTLTVDATAKTVSCLAGAGLFANFRIGRDVQLSSFTNGGNNTTEEVTALIDNDTIEISGATTLVNETDIASRVAESPNVDEKAVIAEIVVWMDRANEMKDALDNVAVATADRRNDFNNHIW